MQELPLIILQVICLVTVSVLSVILLSAHFLQDGCPRRYGVSRAITTVAMLIYVAHYAVQIIFGIRRDSSDIGALVNILFYAPAGYLLSYAHLRLETNSRNLLRFIRCEVVAYAVILLFVGIGYVQNGSLHIGGWLYAADMVYFLSILLAFGMPMMELRRISKRLDRELGQPADSYIHCMTMGSLLMLIFAGTTPFYIFYLKAMGVICPFVMTAMTIYTVSFIALGFKMRSISEMVETENSEAEEPSLPEPLDDALPAADSHDDIEAFLDAWRTTSGYRDSELTLISFCRQAHVSKSAFTRYLQQHEGTTFRVWLSNIRMEEAKRMLREHPDFSNDVIAAECGFSSRVYFQRLFKATTGMTPLEWKASCGSE